MWSRPWHVITCEMTAPSRKSFLWMQMADPPAFRLFGYNVPKSRNWGTRIWIAWKNSSFPWTSWRQMTSLFSASRVKEMCFCSPDNCEDVGDPISPLVFQETHRIPPPGTCAHVFLSNRCGCTFGGWRECRRVANANVDENNEHSQDVHRLHLLATVNDQIEQVLLMEPMVTQRT